MRTSLRHAALLFLAGWLSWWFLLRVPSPLPAPGAREPVPVLRLLPLVRESDANAPSSPPPKSAQLPEPVPPLAADPPPAPLPEAGPTDSQAAEPPASERGTPEGREAEESALTAVVGEEAAREVAVEAPVDAGESALATQPAPAPAASAPALELPGTLPSRSATPEDTSGTGGSESPEHPDSRAQRADVGANAVELLLRDPALLAAAEEEFARGNRKGFATVLLAAPEEQVEIARFFGEELVLVPRAALDPACPDPRYFRITRGGAPRVEEVEGAPPLEGHRQYRDLFDYEYARLPAPLRELRRSLVARGEVYLFAALLSAGEWALIIARRAVALELAGRELAEVRRFVLRYVRAGGNGFDLRVEEIVFADGTRFAPGQPGKGDG